MVDVLLDRSRRTSAGSIETFLVAAQGLGFGLMPVLLVWHRHDVEPLLWVIGGPALIVSLIAAALAVWRLFGRELIAIEDGSLVICRGVGRLRRRWVVPLSTVTDVSLRPFHRSDIPTNVFGFGHCSLQVSCGTRSYPCCVAVGSSTVQSVAERIRGAVHG